MLPHLSVRHTDMGFRHQGPQPFVEPLDTAYPVVQEIHLAAPADLPQDRVPDQGVGILRHDCLDGDPVFRRCFQDAHVPDPGHAHMQRPGNGCGAQRQHVHLPFHVLDGFLVCHTEALLLVHDEQAQVFELYILRQQAVGPDDDVDLPCGQLCQDLFLFFRGPETAQVIHPGSGVPEPFDDRSP